jgi:carboxylesterase type B
MLMMFHHEYLLFSGLFHGAISQSGSVFMPWVLPPADPLAKAKEQAQVVGCPNGNSTALVRCLRGMEAKGLVKNEVSNTLYWK